MSGTVCFVLHAHLPFVRHPRYPDFLEERWLFEAITGSYLPLLQCFERLADEQVPARFAMSFSPTLLSMLGDELLQARYHRYLDRLISLTEREIDRTRFQPHVQELVRWYHRRFTGLRRLYFEDYHGDIVRAFRKIAAAGIIEPLTCAATHGYLPLIEPNRAAVRAQINVGIEAFRKAFGKTPAGFWLPECGYVPGHEALLADQGVRYTMIEAHGLLFANPRPKYGVYAPVECGGIAAFGRDLAASKSVWSATEGYPKDPSYREFHRDIADELEYDYLSPYLAADGSRVPTGLKYKRITGPTEDKDWYDPKSAEATIARDAAHFVAQRQAQVSAIRRHMDRDPAIVACFDAELFGHWWFEGPDWLYAVAVRAAETEDLLLRAPGDVIDAGDALQRVAPSLSSWGVQGYHEMWLNGANDWIYRRLHEMSDQMVRYADLPEPSALHKRILNQMARELMLAQASDWAFILKTQAHSAYAYQRLNEHANRFARLGQMVHTGQIDEAFLREIELEDNCFSWIDYRVYASGQPALGDGVAAAAA